VWNEPPSTAGATRSFASSYRPKAWHTMARTARVFVSSGRISRASRLASSAFSGSWSIRLVRANSHRSAWSRGVRLRAARRTDRASFGRPARDNAAAYAR
jgi:hypothetical protein